MREARLLLGIYLLLLLISVAAGSAALLYLWLGPVLLGQPFLRLYLLAEHTGCPLVANMLENSRTTLSLAPLRRLAWNNALPRRAPCLSGAAVPRAAGRAPDPESAIMVQASGYIAVHREILAGLQPGGAAADRPELSRNARRS